MYTVNKSKYYYFSCENVLVFLKCINLINGLDLLYFVPYSWYSYLKCWFLVLNGLFTGHLDLELYNLVLTLMIIIAHKLT